MIMEKNGQDWTNNRRWVIHLIKIIFNKTKISLHCVIYMQLLKVKNNVNKLAQTKLSLKIETCTLLHVHTKLWKQSNLKKPMELGLVQGTQRIKIQCHEFFPKPPPQPSARDTSVSIAISKKTFKNKQKQSSTIKIGAQAKKVTKIQHTV